ncbi:hypothetical protein FIBSPDRAFT_852059 [Athelia psychrophila]|uniref:Homeobox domain-containing protein n=1 Tax=Athelia psychrophila TaxID=1759441 RepID=A0A166RYK6_9AGAM|nr:hypothetical protein FIBSPDRAFT_852059 [Fibularhizoctonia sp. CBS 109695]
MLPEPRSTRSVSSRLPIKAKSQQPATRRTCTSPATPPSEKKPRRRMTDEQTMKLDALYDEKTHPTTQEKRCLGQEIGL